MSSQDSLELQELHVCVENSEVALGFPLLQRASGEAGPGRPATGTGAVAWDRLLAVRQWHSNQANTTRVSATPERLGAVNDCREHVDWFQKENRRGYTVQVLLK